MHGVEFKLISFTILSAIRNYVTLIFIYFTSNHCNEICAEGHVCISPRT
jgi:hypothetical protein